MSNNDNKRHFEPKKKYEIVKVVIIGKTLISEIRKRYGINTGQYYKWQQAFLNGAIDGLRHKKSARETSKKGNFILERKFTFKHKIKTT